MKPIGSHSANHIDLPIIWFPADVLIILERAGLIGEVTFQGLWTHNLSLTTAKPHKVCGRRPTII